MHMRRTQKKLLPLLLFTIFIICMVVSPVGVLTVEAKTIVKPARTIDLSNGDVVLSYIDNDNVFLSEASMASLVLNSGSTSTGIKTTHYGPTPTDKRVYYDLNADGSADIVEYDRDTFEQIPELIISKAKTCTINGSVTIITPQTTIDAYNRDELPVGLYSSVTFILSPDSSQAAGTTPDLAENTNISEETPTTPTAEEIIAQFDISKTYTAKEADTVVKDFVDGLKALGVAIVPEFTEQVTAVNPVLGQALKSALGQTTAVEPASASTSEKDTTAPASEETAENPPAETPAAAGGSYTVEQGDSLFKIAKKAYGDGKLWKKIYEANKDQIRNTKEYIIYAGQNFVIPTIQ